MVENDADIVEGGDFSCYEHNFKTPSKIAWDTHRVDFNHKENGTTLCIYCGLSTNGSFDIMPDLKLKAICDICGPLHEEEPNGIRVDRSGAFSG